MNNLFGKMFKHLALTRLPFTFDVLHDADAHAVADRARDQAKGGRRLTLAFAGMHNQQTFLDGLGRQNLVARGLAFA